MVSIIPSMPRRRQLSVATILLFAASFSIGRSPVDAFSPVATHTSCTRCLPQESSVMGTSSRLYQTADTRATDEKVDDSLTKNAAGLYRPFAEHAWTKLLQLDNPSLQLQPDDSIPAELLSNIAPAKGFPDGSVVRMQTRALQPSSSSGSSKIRYARYALLETLVPSSSDNSNDTPYNSTAGIQVLNLVIFPSASTNLPVFGADMVSLPGDKHLLLLDAQPMGAASRAKYQDHWKDWHNQYVNNNDNDENQQQAFPWGGDIPEQVAQYVSDYALWTRFVGEKEGAITKIQEDLWEAFQAHLDLYLELLSSSEDSETATSSSDGVQEPYIQYRLQNDPARPMLKSLYGEEWTERVLEEVLFPK